LLENFLAKQRAKIAESLIDPSRRSGCIADIGCGSHPFFLLNTQFAVKIGLDKTVSPESSRLTLQDTINLIHCDIEKDEDLPLEDNSCDVVTMLAFIEHIDRQEASVLLKEIYRILKPGGSLILTTPASWTDSLLRFLAGLRLVSPEEIMEHKVAYTIADLSEMLGTVFPENRTRFGYFEAFMNIWAKAIK
jgi:ubiquinone/menaquinone biosynthesis C-methylase UbiE